MSENSRVLQWHRILFHILIPPISIFFILAYFLPLVGIHDFWAFHTLGLSLLSYIVYLVIRVFVLFRPSCRAVSGLAGVFLFGVSALLIQIMVSYHFGNQSRIINSFPLNDAQGRYIVSYDGDYWLTYYIDANRCFETTPPCNQKWEKKGAAPIYSSTVKLDKYLNVPVSVTAAWQAIHYQIPPTTEDDFLQHPSKEYRKFCVQSGLYQECVDSRGPQYWSSSPLLIETIEIK
jgi:hypothetical protein